MKSRLLVLSLIGLLLSSCSNASINGSNSLSSGSNINPTTSGSGSAKEDEESEVDSIQDLNILHAWNWKLNDVKARLGAIKKAGYGAIQLSPMQPKVDNTQWSTESTKSQWWKLYQPLGFKVSEANETFLGTKDDLRSLCSAAKTQGLEIVMDVVCNHLAGKDKTYSGQVYKQYNLHDYDKTNDNSVEAVVRGHIGLPDLDTSTSEVQSDALAMLKEYVDCGVTGFRFDAAKHIETPDDGEFASNFWPTILDGLNSYANSKNIAKPYYYGEILNTCGVGRSFSSYTKMMSVVDNNYATEIVQAVNENDSSSLKSVYNTGVSPDKLVLWAESHDTYANDSGYDITYSFPVETINKAYMIQASRKDAATLYFARPTSLYSTICSIDDNSGWQNAEVTAINKFHRHYLDKSENISIENGCFVSVRGKGSFAGAAIINVSDNSSKEINVSGLANGTFVDLISGNEFEVRNGKVNASFTKGGCILVPKGSIEVDPVEPTYTSSLILKGYNQSLSYFSWVWPTNGNGSWKEFTTDLDAIGINLNTNDNYTIVEFPNGTTLSNIDWNKKIRQTIDYSYSGLQTFVEYDNLSWK